MITKTGGSVCRVWVFLSFSYSQRGISPLSKAKEASNSNGRAYQRNLIGHLLGKVACHQIPPPYWNSLENNGNLKRYRLTKYRIFLSHKWYNSPAPALRKTNLLDSTSWTSDYHQHTPSIPKYFPFFYLIWKKILLTQTPSVHQLTNSPNPSPADQEAPLIALLNSLLSPVWKNWTFQILLNPKIYNGCYNVSPKSCLVLGYALWLSLAIYHCCIQSSLMRQIPHASFPALYHYIEREKSGEQKATLFLLLLCLLL